MDYLEQRGLIKPWSRSDLLGNTLVLIASAFSKVRLAIYPGYSLTSALGDGRLAMAEPTAATQPWRRLALFTPPLRSLTKPQLRGLAGW